MKLYSVLAAMAVLFLGTLAAPAATLTFDDITSLTLRQIPAGYGGLDWSEFWVRAKGLPDSGYMNGVLSGGYSAFNGYAKVASVTGPAFDLESAYLTAAWNNGLTVEVEGYRGAAMAYNRKLMVDTSSPTLVNFHFLNIDRLVFRSFGGTPVSAGAAGDGTHFVLDDFTFNFSPPPLAASVSVNAVPLPAAAWAGLALIGSLTAARCLRKSAIGPSSSF